MVVAGSWLSGPLMWSNVIALMKQNISDILEKSHVSEFSLGDAEV